ncbi:MAG: restriction endonuclease subunit S [Rickettsiales bacterium]|jgi:hypothetical protein|nr:restriction endonuclease subunit S [Rickettsiales bacterium]
MDDKIRKCCFVCNVLKSCVDASSVLDALTLLQEAKIRGIPTNSNKLQEFLISIVYECDIKNPFKSSNDAIRTYNIIYDILDWEVVLYSANYDNFKMFSIPQAIIEQFENRFFDKKGNVLICEGEKFILSLKKIIDVRPTFDFTITVQSSAYKMAIEGFFFQYSNVHVVATDIYKYGFINSKFDLILSVPRFGSRSLIDENQSFICREHEMAATENLLLHLTTCGKLLIVLPARITFSAGRIQELRRFIQEMYKLEEIAELPSWAFQLTGIKTCLFTIASGKTEYVNIRRYNLVETKNNATSLDLKDETFVMLSDLETLGDWNIDRIFALQDDDWNKYQTSNIKKVELGNFAEIFRGKAVNNKDENGRIGVINISNLREFDIDYDTLIHLDEEERKISGYLLKSGDLLLPARGTAIRTAVFQEQSYPCIASANIIVIRPNEKQLLGTYLKIFFDSDIGVKIIKAAQQGGIIINIRYKDLNNIQIPFLPFEEQMRIAEEYQNKLRVYQDSVKFAEYRWFDALKRLQNNFRS